MISVGKKESAFSCRTRLWWCLSKLDTHLLPYTIYITRRKRDLRGYTSSLSVECVNFIDLGLHIHLILYYLYGLLDSSGAGSGSLNSETIDCIMIQYNTKSTRLYLPPVFKVQRGDISHLENNNHTLINRTKQNSNLIKWPARQVVLSRLVLSRRADHSVSGRSQET